MCATKFLLTIVFIITQFQQRNAGKDKHYRYDYHWDEKAQGWLKYHKVPASWDEARRRCYAEGAVLASPLTFDLKSAIVRFVREHNSYAETFFSGVHATFSRGDFTSIEGVPLLRMAITWAPREPNNLENAESCLAMSVEGGGVLSDVRCSDILPYVCYKKATKLTITECGTIDPGYLLEVRTGSCYKFHKRPLMWSEAFMTCLAEGGHLVVINNAVEARVVLEIFNRHPANSLHAHYGDSLLIGFHDWGRFGSSFMTIHGEALEDNYHNWATGEPNNWTHVRTGDSGQFCGSLYRKEDAILHDFYCNYPAVFLCEKKPNSLA